MEGKYIPFNDGYGIVGFGYECPKCEHVTWFVTCEIGCEECGFAEPFYVDPDDWFGDFLKKNRTSIFKRIFKTKN